jgi:uncharacterized metal-binding protein YceD (DUF177 family)
MMTRSVEPFSAIFDLGTLRESGAEITLAPKPAERAAIAQWLGIESLDSFKAAIRLSRHGEDHYFYEARFEADVVQACVITLDPVPSHLSGEFRRALRLLPRPSKAKRRKTAAVEAPAAIELAALDPGVDEPELLDSPLFDLAAPVLEELSLALDPYPKAPGAVFEAPPEPADPSENPFAVLEKLKTAAPPKPRSARKPASGKKTT